MQPRRAIVIAVDGLRASALGAYGNAWHPTPSFDRLASESLAFDWMFVDSPSLAGFYRAAWLGAAAPRDGVERDPADWEGPMPLPRQLATAGIRTALTTDDAWAATQADRLGFADVRGVEFPAPAPAEAIADTELAQLMAIVAEQIEGWAEAGASAVDAPPASLLWIHARGFHGAWDAPLELRQSLLDEEDPPALNFLHPPARLVTDDHDAMLLHRAAYAAQAMVLDECLGMLTATLEATGLSESTLLVAVGCRGFALGEHGVVGAEVAELYGELSHVPLLVRLPGRATPPPPRDGQLVQPVDLHASLLHWFQLADAPSRGFNLIEASDAVAADNAGGRPAAFSIGSAGELAVRTHAWALRRPASNDSSGGAAEMLELYSKPDDRWEANEVADRCPEELDAMLQLAQQRLAPPAADSADR